MGRILRVHVEEACKAKGYIFEVHPDHYYKYEITPDSRYHTEFGTSTLCQTLQECWQELQYLDGPDKSE